MQIFELSNKATKNGRRSFKAILFEVYPDESVKDNTGTQYNDNGITWLEKYCVPHLDTIKGMSITAEFLDEERTEILGHGNTGIEDGIPVFDNATMIGSFERGYITDYVIDGETKRVCMGEGTLDEMRYKKFIDSLASKLAIGEKLYGSIEIFKNPEKQSIEYLNGYKAQGRIPVDFIFSGFALLGIRPADMAAGLIELNNKQNEEDKQLDDKILSAFVSDIKNTIIETNSKNSECESKIKELNMLSEEKDKKIVEKDTTIKELQAAIKDVEDERDRNLAELDNLRKQIADMKIEKRLADLNNALKDYTEEEKAYGKSEIDAFKKDPLCMEINSIVTKINASAYAAMKHAKISEQNASSMNSADEDIYGEVIDYSPNSESGSIF